MGIFPKLSAYVKAEIEATRNEQCFGDVRSLERGRIR